MHQRKTVYLSNQRFANLLNGNETANLSNIQRYLLIYEMETVKLSNRQFSLIYQMETVNLTS